MNFGGFATPERNIIFDINDLDETLPAPWEWDVKRLVASVVVAGQYLRLSETDSARARRWRRCAPIASIWSTIPSMRALQIWYDHDLLERAEDLTGPEDHRRKPRRSASKSGEGAHSPDFLYPKLVEHQGRLPRDQRQPAIDLSSHGGAGSGAEVRIRKQVALTANRCPSTLGCCSIVSTCATSRSRRSASAASAHNAPSGCGWLRRMTLYSCRSRKPRRQCWSPMRARASTEPRRAGRGRPTSHAVRERYVPWVDEGKTVAIITSASSET